jgi:uncharacterized membrane protein YjdF
VTSVIGTQHAYPITDTLDQVNEKTTRWLLVTQNGIKRVSEYFLPFIGLICFIIAAFVFSVIVGFVVCGLSCFALKFLIEIGQKSASTP